MNASIIVIILVISAIDLIKGGPATCSDGITKCDGCQCCPDLTTCPNASGCPAGFFCPNDKKRNNNGGNGENSNHGNGGNHGRGGGNTDHHKIIFENRCNQDIWVGALGAGGKVTPQNGGWFLGQSRASTISLPLHWSGRFWGRTNCRATSNGQFFCATGDCGRKKHCNGAGGVPPATLAEFTFNAHGGLDFYDVSLVDGYNLPLTITPVHGTYETNAGICREAGCTRDLNLNCPPELRKTYNGRTVGCSSACAALRDNKYCCHGEYNCSPHAGHCPAGKRPCDPNTWAVNYARIFKSACPTSYSFAYDDPSSTFTCAGNPQVNYKITFCS